MARWINVKAVFDYHWPGRSAVTHFSDAELGDQYVKDEVADFAVEKGYATEGKVDEASRSSKGKREKGAKAAESGEQSPVGDEDAADADRAADRPAVDDAAG